ncbi:uncharacterized protein LOC118344276 [Juglans regia]|uniref:Uncharacterized protein LOC118344276 n=1 Tax=Juglans regia TaxID=51240 RepID=A0A6P9DZE0_JUGRE|nr:uncharacterized protein LOC118344276 [Juglans regia]
MGYLGGGCVLWWHKQPMGWGCGRRLDRDGVFSRYICGGDGSRVRFWRDAWCGDRALKDTFSTIYKIAGGQEASMVELFEISVILFSRMSISLRRPMIGRIVIIFLGRAFGGLRCL